MPFWHTNNAATTCTSTSSSSSSATTSSSSMSSNSSNNGTQQQTHMSHEVVAERSTLFSTTNTMSLVAKSLLPTRRKLRLDPPNKLYFPYEPGKQVRSAIGIKNISKSHVAFKFQTTAPKSCYMRPPGGILGPGESIIATVFKFVEPPENNESTLDQKSRVKFKIMSLKVKGEMEYVPEMFDEQKEQVTVEQISRVIFVDPESDNPALEKVKRQLAEAEAELEARKKPAEASVVGEEGVIDEWKERRVRYLARQQIQVESV